MTSRVIVIDNSWQQNYYLLAHYSFLSLKTCQGGLEQVFCEAPEVGGNSYDNTPRCYTKYCLTTAFKAARQYRENLAVTHAFTVEQAVVQTHTKMATSCDCIPDV
jgi:hypothetical protein